MPIHISISCDTADEALTELRNLAHSLTGLSAQVDTGRKEAAAAAAKPAEKPAPAEPKTEKPADKTDDGENDEAARPPANSKKKASKKKASKKKAASKPAEPKQPDVPLPERKEGGYEIDDCRDMGKYIAQNFDNGWDTLRDIIVGLDAENISDIGAKGLETEFMDAAFDYVDEQAE